MENNNKKVENNKFDKGFGAVTVIDSGMILTKNIYSGLSYYILFLSILQLIHLA